MYKIKIFMLASVLLACSLPVLAQQSDDWRGFYVGGNLFASSDKTAAAGTLQINQISNLVVTGRGIVVVPGTTRDLTASERNTKWGAGLQSGYQWQSGKFVFGAEGDFNPSNRTLSVSQTFQLPTTILEPSKTISARRDIRLSREFSIRGRGGAALGKTLVYGAGGYSNSQVRVSSIDSYTNPGGTAPTGCGAQPNICFNSGAEGPVVTTAASRQNMGGWNVGAGVEYKLSRHLSIGVEYRHTDLRSKTFTLSSQTTVNNGSETRGDNGATGQLGSVSTGPTSLSLKSDSFRARVNFHF